MRFLSPTNAWHSPVLTRLLLVLALLPLLQLPLPVLHCHAHGADVGSSPLPLSVHVHRLHHDHDETAGNCHWHFIPLGDWGWLGLPLDTAPLDSEYLGVTIVREPQLGNDSCDSACFLAFDWASLSQPPSYALRYPGPSCAVPCWGSSASARTRLVQLLCEQRC